jgi:hypothetical protein
MPWPKYARDAKNSGINPDRGDPTDAFDDPSIVPDRFAIVNNYPNPFNPATTIKFSVDRSSEISLDIYNILGQNVTTLVSGLYSAGLHTIIWNGTDRTGNEVASGVYFARLIAEGRNATRKMILLR